MKLFDHPLRLRAILGLLAFLSGLGLVGCGKKGIPAPQGGADVPPSKVNLRRSVELCRVQQKAIVSNVEIVGIIEPESITSLPAGVNGIIDEILFREGDLVDPAENKPLLRIDQRRYADAMKIAEASLTESIALSSAADDLARRAESGGASIAPELRKQAIENAAAARAKVNIAKANLSIAKLNFQRSAPPPPFKGQINQRLVQPGAYVEEKTIIATMCDLSRLRLTGYIPESVSALVRRRHKARNEHLAVRQTALMLQHLTPANGWGRLANETLIASGELPSGYDPEFFVQALPNRQFRAAIFYMSTNADPSTHMFEFKAEIDPRTPGFSELNSGYSAKIRLPIETNPQSMIIPEEAVRATERGFIVFEPFPRSNRDGQTEWVARPKRVEVGVRSPGYVEVRSGLLPGQWIVQRGAEALEDGTPLRFDPAIQKMIEGQ